MKPVVLTKIHPLYDIVNRYSVVKYLATQDEPKALFYMNSNGLYIFFFTEQGIYFNSRHVTSPPECAFYIAKSNELMSNFMII